jgi:hypothetical protein
MIFVELCGIVELFFMWKLHCFSQASGRFKDIKMLDKDVNLRKNDAYIYDKKTFYQQKVDLKTVNGGSIKAKYSVNTT